MTKEKNRRIRIPSSSSRRRLESELDWFFGYAEHARRFHGVTMLPSYAAERARARDVARQARRCWPGRGGTHRLYPHAMVLRAVFAASLADARRAGVPAA